MGYSTRRITDETARTLLPEITRKPYDNAVIIADIVQLYRDCEFYVAFADGKLAGLMSFNTCIPFYSTGFYCPDTNSLPDLLNHVYKTRTDLKDKPIFSLVGARLKDQLEQNGYLIHQISEYRMRYIPNTIKLKSISDSIKIIKLNDENILEISRLYSIVPAMAWTPKSLISGPYYGAFDGSMLVAIAGVQFNTKYIAEIGNVVCLPMYQRKGLARACTQAVINDLMKDERIIFLCVYSDNIPAINLYLNMGFELTDTSYLCKYSLSPATKNLATENKHWPSEIS